MQPHTPDQRPMRVAFLNGLRCRCPNCGRGRLYQGYLKPVEHCPVCGIALGDNHQVGLLLPFVVITILGHILVFALLELARHEVNPLLSLAVVVPLTIVGSLALLPPVKGALLGILWSRNLSDEQR